MRIRDHMTALDHDAERLQTEVLDIAVDPDRNDRRLGAQGLAPAA